MITNYTCVKCGNELPNEKVTTFVQNNKWARICKTYRNTLDKIKRFKRVGKTLPGVDNNES